MLVMLSSGLAAHAQSPQPPTSSAKSSPSSATAADKNDAFENGLIGACAAAAEELSQSRGLIDALERENGLLRQRLETERRFSETLGELNAARRSEAGALRAALTAKDETIDAKDKVIAAQERLVDALKKKRTSPWKRLGDVLIGAAAAIILK
jgi:hypothetical protein